MMHYLLVLGCAELVETFWLIDSLITTIVLGFRLDMWLMMLLWQIRVTVPPRVAHVLCAVWSTTVCSAAVRQAPQVTLRSPASSDPVAATAPASATSRPASVSLRVTTTVTVPVAKYARRASAAWSAPTTLRVLRLAGLLLILFFYI